MLKKLVKYGNSNALVLDKAIMELLNMQEGSVVKFTTDGKSLIITPVEHEKASSITPNAVESLLNVSNEVNEAAKTDPATKRVLEQWAPGTENFARLTEAMASVKFIPREASLFASPEFGAEADALAAKHCGDKSSKAFVKDFAALQEKYAPGYYSDMRQKMREAAKKIGYPIDLFAAGVDGQ